MAKMQSTMFNVIRGSIAGTTFLSNSYAPIIARARTKPVNPKTTRQTLMRSAFAQAQAAWNGQTPADIALWEAWATTVERQGPLGPYNPAARGLAMGQYSLSRFLVMLGLGTLTVSSMAPPTKNGDLTMGSLEIGPPSVPGTGFGVTCTNLTGEDINVVWTPSFIQNDSRLRFQGPWNTAAMAAFEAPNSTSAIDDYLMFQDGDVVFFRIRGISSDTPRRVSPEYLIRAIAQTTAA